MPFCSSCTCQYLFAVFNRMGRSHRGPYITRVRRRVESNLFLSMGHTEFIFGLLPDWHRGTERRRLPCSGRTVLAGRVFCDVGVLLRCWICVGWNSTKSRAGGVQAPLRHASFSFLEGDVTVMPWCKYCCRHIPMHLPEHRVLQVNFHFISALGAPIEGWAILFYITHL